MTNEMLEQTKPAEALWPMNLAGAAKPALVVGIDADGGLRVEVQGQLRRAQLAVASGYRPEIGDRVLLIAGEGDTYYAIGVLRAAWEAGAHQSALSECSDGTQVSLEESSGEQVLRVKSANGAVLFEHFPGQQRSVVRAEGALEVRAQSGDLNLVSDKKVRIQSGQGVELEAPSFTGKVERARLEADTVVTAARVVETTAELVRQTVGILDTNAQRILERAKEAFRDVEGLAQTRAGRVRMIAEKTFRVLGERTHIKARKDMKLRGQRIYLD